MATVASLNVLMTMDTTQADKAMSSFKTKLDAWGKSITNLGQKLSLGVTAPLTALGVSAIDAASDLNESMSAVRTIFGDAAESVSGFSTSVASSLGLSRNEALQAATQIGALGQSLGLTGMDLSTFSNQVLSAASDLGSFYNADPSEVLDAIRSGLIGEAEPLRRFGILLSDAALSAKALEMGLDGDTKKLTEQQKVMLRQAIIMEQLGAAEGDRAKTSGSLANQMVTLRKSFDDLRASLGKFLAPFATKFVGLLQRAVDWVGKLSEEQQKWIIIIGALAAALGPVLIAIGTMLPVLGAIGAVIGVILSPVGLLIAALVALGVIIFQAIGGWDGLVKIAGDLGAALQPLRDVVDELVSGFRDGIRIGLNPFEAALFSLHAWLINNFGEDNPISRFVGFVREAAAGLGDAFARLVDAAQKGGLSGFLEQLGEELGNFATFALDQLRQAWPHLVAWIRDTALPAVLDALGNLAGMILPVIGGWIVSLIGALRENWPRIRLWLETEGIPAFVKALAMLAIAIPALVIKLIQALVEHWPEITAWIQDTGIPLLKTALETGWAILKEVGGTLITGFWNGIKEIWEQQVGPWLMSIPQWIVNLFAGAGEWLKQAGINLIQGFWNGIIEKWNEMITWLNEQIGKLPGMFNQASQPAQTAGKSGVPSQPEAGGGAPVGARGTMGGAGGGGRMVEQYNTWNISGTDPMEVANLVFAMQADALERALAAR